MCLVGWNNNPTPSKTSATPVRYTRKAGNGTIGGIIIVIPFVNRKWPEAVSISIRHMARLPANAMFQSPKKSFEINKVAVKLAINTINGFMVCLFLSHKAPYSKQPEK